MDVERPDTTPGFEMESPNFSLTFVTGLQRGVASNMLEMETDWFDMMEILLSRLEDEPTNQIQFEVIAATCLEMWALHQPGGDTLFLRIKVEVEEQLYGRQMKLKELGRWKAIKLTFNDPNTTQVIFHARKKLRLQRLKEIAAVRTADQLLNVSAAKQLADEGLIPAALVQDLTLACLDTWTQRYSRLKLYPCCLAVHPYWPGICLCKGEEKSKLLISVKLREESRQRSLMERLQEVVRGIARAQTHAALPPSERKDSQ